MFTHETQLRICYADTDQMGFVYYGHYAKFFEIGRTESIRSLGMTYKEMEEDGVMLPVLENFSKYIKPAKYDDLITIRTKLLELPKVKLQFEYEIYNQDNELLHTGWTKLAFMSKDTYRPCRAPQKFLELIAPFFVEPTEA
ncbi:acyl-CoA thioesterase [Flammeovirga yaeyamensis]|uniref:Acyl-CoA thioesterase n=1 Tax=Flammeovirga yaeyamensis TaxID=367791 RepID=A0AAX1N4V3_9BACT|nr:MULTISPECIES: thioesterase family protein [Flammeovirga]ANQ50098.1 acyl-CoA thioesterase [Flammeovirga sp. MY04]MBB3700382.1 acyl-CoA thioester hydrolase [Flammeovirga yaeyamensis]NMF36992.1 acyl-CoA thioesterase [Flammeovirga yaeyamensis]QWG02464.1 acyl-CoA thioesterase [Flammeovirga yaeyamensis]